MSRLSVSLAVILVSLSCVVLAYDGPVYQMLPLSPPLSFPTTGSTDLATRNQLFFDVPVATLQRQLDVTLSFTYPNDTSLKVLAVMQRWAPISSDYSAAMQQCVQSQQWAQSINPYECFYQEVLVDAPLEKMQNLTVAFPRSGRYYIAFLASQPIKNGTSVSYSIAVEAINCDSGKGGDNCAYDIESTSWNGPQSQQFTGSVAANDWKYWTFATTQTLSELQVEFGNIALDQVGAPDPGDVNLSGYYMRYDNTPSITQRKSDWQILNPGNSVANWIAPPAGNYYLGVFGGDNGTDYNFRLSSNTCGQDCLMDAQEPETGVTCGGAFCLDKRRPAEWPLCDTPRTRSCQSRDYSITNFTIPYTVTVIPKRWTYAHFVLPRNQYRAKISAFVIQPQVTDEFTMVLNPTSIPENNGENEQQMFALGDVYRIYKHAAHNDVATIEYMYASAGAGVYYIGFWTDSPRENGFQVQFTVELAECPGADGACNGNGACNTVKSVCECNANVKITDPIDCQAQAKPPKHSNGGLSTGAIVALVICVPLALLLVVGIIGFGVWWIKYHRPQYDTIG